MFAFAHAFVAIKVLGSYNPVLLFGAILPDYIWNSQTIRYQRNIHYDPFGFYIFIKRNYKTLLPLAKGVLLHSDISHGLDWYSDDNDIGYAMILGKQLMSKTQKAFKLDSIKAADFSHNFVEAALDLILAEKNPKLAQRLSKIKNVVFFSKIDEALSVFSNSSLIETRQAIDGLFKFYLRKNLQSEESIVSTCLATIAKNRFNVDDKKISEKLTPILKRAKSLVYPTYEQFLDQTISSMKHDAMLEQYLMT